MKSIEMYAGGGGAALGLRNAGLKSVALIERDPDACATLRAAGFDEVNEGTAEDWVRDEARGFSPCGCVYGGACTCRGRVFLGWFSPPCQPHSQQGDGRGLGDPREGTNTVIAAVDAVWPRWVVVENVMGYASSEAGRKLCKALVEQNYTVSVLYLTASDFGVPQDRRRTFIIGGPARIDAIEPTGPRPSMASAIGEHLHDAETRRGNRARPNSEPCRTVGTRGNTMVWDDTQRRRRALTVAEAAAIQGFPPDHPWQGNKTSQYRQVGNAVPPKLAEVVARAVIAANQENP